MFLKKYQSIDVLYGHINRKWNIDILEMLNVPINAREAKLSKKRYQFLNILYEHTTMKWNIDILEMAVLDVEYLYKCYQFN